MTSGNSLYLDLSWLLSIGTSPSFINTAARVQQQKFKVKPAMFYFNQVIFLLSILSCRHNMFGSNNPKKVFYFGDSKKFKIVCTLASGIRKRTQKPASQIIRFRHSQILLQVFQIFLIITKILAPIHSISHFPACCLFRAKSISTLHCVENYYISSLTPDNTRHDHES